MYTKAKFSFHDLIMWTRFELMWFALLGVVPTALYQLADFKWLQLPWTPIALVGTAVAFLIGFQSNAAYGRIWEARKIWGGIVNASRTFAVLTLDTVTDEHAKEPIEEAELDQHRHTIVRRHIAWLTALRHTMRLQKPWEDADNYERSGEWKDRIHVPEFESTLAEDLEGLLSEEEKTEVLGRTNRSTALLHLQSQHLRRLKEKGIIWEFSFLELESLIAEFFTLQGKSERIKNFPYPRQFATIGTDFVRVFIAFLPFGVIPNFAQLGEKIQDSHPLIAEHFVWLSVPFIMVVAWVFHTMYRIGKVGENPFSASANDVPISAISRGIEIDLLEMLHLPKEEIPKPFPSTYDIQM